MNPQSSTANYFRPVQTLGTALATLFALLVVTWSLRVIGDWVLYGQLASHLSGGLSREGLWGDSALIRTSFLQFVPTVFAFFAALAALVVLLVWVSRARRNAAVLNPSYHFRYSPGFAVGGLLIPVANIWYYRAIFEEIWLASDPAANPGPARPVRTWWNVLIFGTVVGCMGWISLLSSRLSTITYGSDGSLVSGGDEALSNLATINLWNTALGIFVAIYFVLFAGIVRQISRWQTDRFTAPHVVAPPAGPRPGPKPTWLD
jgi:hypothetical protein